MKNAIVIFILLPVLVISCSKEKTPTNPASAPTGGLVLSVGDSYHLNDTTASWSATVNYQLQEGSTPSDSGTILIPNTSQLGDIFTKSIDSLKTGGFTVTFKVQRPFVIIGRKDDVGKARFSDTISVSVPPYSFSEAPSIDIWAYRLNRLWVYFNDGVTTSQADSTMRSIGVQILARNQTLVDHNWFYLISTLEPDRESDLKPLIEGAPGVRSVFFDIYGHSYF